MSTNYITEDLIAGQIETDQVNLKADVYYRGMPLKYTSGSNYYEYSVSEDDVCAIFMESETRTLATAGYGSVILGGAVYEGGIVDDSGDELTITDDFIAAVAKNGIYIKRT